MEQIGTKFKETGLSKIWTWITVIGLFIIVVVVLWMCFVLKTVHPVFYSCIINGAFFIVFVTFAVLFWMIFKKTSECIEKSKEFNRKIVWEEFQFALYREERINKYNYDSIKALIEKMDDKEIKQEQPLKEEIDKFRKEIDEWKELKDKQIFVEIVNGLKS
jgi:hypothetical protein